MRLVARGISPAIATPVQLEDVEVSSAQQRAAQILSFIPLFIVHPGPPLSATPG